MKGLSGTQCDLSSILLPCFSALFCYVSFWLLYWLSTIHLYIILVVTLKDTPSASPVGQMVKNLPVMLEVWVWPLAWEDPLEKGTATHSSILAWEIPWMEEPGSYSLSSVQFSRSVISNSLRPHESQHTRPPCPSPTPRVHVHWVRDAIQPSHPLSSSSPPAPNPSQHQGLFQWVNTSHEVASLLEFRPQHQSFQRTPRAGLLQDGLVGSPCSPRDSQESPPTPQIKSIVSLALSFLDGPTLTSIHDHWKNHRLD